MSIISTPIPSALTMYLLQDLRSYGDLKIEGTPSVLSQASTLDNGKVPVPADLIELTMPCTSAHICKVILSIALFPFHND